MADTAFNLHSEYQPAGDQPTAIAGLVEGIHDGLGHQTLLGVTGSGKTFTMANVIQDVQRPTIILAPNKTLAAQLYGEFKAFFPENAVEYFVSYYDYYQPEAYVPSSDTFIEKDASVNEHIEQMRLSATKAILERRDTIIVATVSAIYGLGDPASYHAMVLHLVRGDHIDQRDLLRRLAELQYTRNEMDFRRATYRVRGDVIDIFPAEEEKEAVRIELFDDEIEDISIFDPLTGEVIKRVGRITIYPKSHYVTPGNGAQGHRNDQGRAGGPAQDPQGQQQAGGGPASGAAHPLRHRDAPGTGLLQRRGELLAPVLRPPARRGAAHPVRLSARRRPADRGRIPRHHSPARRHVQRRPLAQGDPGGVRLPAALGPGQPAAEIRGVGTAGAADGVRFRHPGPYEEKYAGQVVEQVVRPTGLVDPAIEVRPAGSQVDDLLGEVRESVEKGERVLVTTLTKRMAEDLTEYLNENGVKVRYLHSDIDTVERVEIIRDLRLGKFDVLVGINLLREGLDMPEVALVAILDADKEGFLRAERSLIQTIGRAARNINGRAILYADEITGSMRRAMDETERRRDKQIAHNKEQGITPQALKKQVLDIMDDAYTTGAGQPERKRTRKVAEDKEKYVARSPAEVAKDIEKLEAEMMEHAKNLEFERAAAVRDKIHKLREEGFMR